MCDPEAKYPDTASGARRFLRDTSDLPKRLIGSATAIPDPYIPGVWAMKMPAGEFVIVYGLGGDEDSIDFEIDIPR